MVTYFLERKKIKNINMRIDELGNISVSVPYGISQKTADDFVRSKYDFILNAREKVASRVDSRALKEPCGNSLFIDIDTLRYMGESYKFQIIKSDEDCVLLDKNNMTITVCTFDTENRAYAERLLANWYYNRMNELFLRLNNETAAAFNAVFGIKKAEVRVKKMKSRWGSCSFNEGIITINSRLVFYPENAVKYVFIHEYSHFIVHNHSADFYRTVERFMPQYKRFSDLLK